MYMEIKFNLCLYSRVLAVVVVVVVALRFISARSLFGASQSCLPAVAPDVAAIPPPSPVPVYESALPM